MEIEFDFTNVITDSAASRENERMVRFIACVQGYVGHELPNQLVAMQAFARLLHEQYAAVLDEEGRMMLDRLAALAQRTDTLARRLAEIGRLLCETPWGLPLSLDEVVREAIAEVNVLESAHGVMFEAPANLPTVYASRRLLHQVLLQLLHNAVKAGSGQPLVVVIGARREPGGVSLWVSDSGKGIGEQEVALFEPFAAGRFAGAAGPGLGLFLVSQATALWGGRLSVQSESGKGSTFSLFLPDLSENQWTN